MVEGVHTYCLLILALGAYFGWIYWREHRFDAVIAAAARRYQMEPALIKAVIWQGEPVQSRTFAAGPGSWA